MSPYSLINLTSTAHTSTHTHRWPMYAYTHTADAWHVVTCTHTPLQRSPEVSDSCSGGGVLRDRGGGRCVGGVRQCFLWSCRRIWLEGLEEDLSCGSQRSDAWIPFFLCCLPPPFLTPPPFISHHIAPKPTCCVLLWLLPLTNFPPLLLYVRVGEEQTTDRIGLVWTRQPCCTADVLWRFLI